MASSTTFSSTYPGLSTPPHPQSDSSPIDSSQFAEVDQSDERADSRNGESNKRLETSDRRPSSAEAEDRASFPGKAASNGAVQAKTKKSGALARSTTKKVKFAKESQRFGSVAGQRRTLRTPQVDSSRPANRILDDGYDSDTRTE